MAAAAILNFASVLPIRLKLNRALCDVPACQIASRLDNTWPSYSELSALKMAAAAILSFASVLLIWLKLNGA